MTLDWWPVRSITQVSVRPPASIGHEKAAQLVHTQADAILRTDEELCPLDAGVPHEVLAIEVGKAVNRDPVAVGARERLVAREAHKVNLVRDADRTRNDGLGGGAQPQKKLASVLGDEAERRVLELVEHSLLAGGVRRPAG
jgi:hypothetical protein